MPRIYSHYHSLAGFISKCIPKRGVGPFKELFVHSIVKGLQRLDSVQRANKAITLAFDSDGINVFYCGALISKIIPAQDGLSLLNLASYPNVTSSMDNAIKEGVIEDRSGGSYRSWKIYGAGLEHLWAFIESLPLPTEEIEPESATHPRAFPPALRQAAYEEFVQNGSYCPGYGRQKKHKVYINKSDRIEFDHILSYSSGGPSTEWNIQVLCSQCNRSKRARCD